MQRVDDFLEDCYTLPRRKFAGVVQLVERLLAKEKVVGSSPIARSDDQG
jgi:hypothetical protein